MRYFFAFFALIILLLIVACQPVAFPATATVAVTKTPTASLTPFLTPSVTLTIKPTPTLTATATLKGPGRFVSTFGAGYFTGVYRSPDGKWAFTIINDKEIRWYDAKTLQQQGSIVLDGAANRIIFGSDENVVAIGGFNKVWLLDITQQKISHVIDIEGDYFRQIEFFQKSKSLIYEQYHPTSGGCYSDLNTWDGENFANLTILTLNCKGSQFAVSPDGTLLVLGYENEIKFWDNWKAGPSKVLNEHTANVKAVAFSADSSLLASADEKGNIYVWDSKTSKHISSFLVMGSIRQIIFINNDQQIQVTLKDQLPQIINLKTKQIQTAPAKEKEIDRLKQVLHHNGYSELSYLNRPIIAVSPSQKLMAVASQSILLWDIDSKNLIGVLENKTGWRFVRLQFDPTGQFLVGTTSNGITFLWDMTKNSEQNIPTILEDKVEDCVIYDCGDISYALGGCGIYCPESVFSSDGKVLALGNDKSVELWNTQTVTKSVILPVLQDKGRIAALQFSKDGKFLYVLKSQADRQSGEIQVWNVSRMQMIRQSKVVWQGISKISWPWLALSIFKDVTIQRIDLFNAETQVRKEINIGQNFYPEGFNQSGQLLLINGLCVERFYILKIATGDFLYQFSKGSFNDFSLLANSNFVASNAAGSVALWDISDILDSVVKSQITPMPSPTYMPCVPG